MTDLNIALPSPAPVTGVRPLLRAAPGREDPTMSGASAFQDALALELGLGLDGFTLPLGVGIPTAAIGDDSLKSTDDKSQVTLAADASSGAVLAGIPLLPLLPGQALAPNATGPAGLAPDSLQDPLLANKPAQSRTRPGLPVAAAATAADFAAPGKISAAVAGEIARRAPGQWSELPQPATVGAADPALAGKSTRAGAGEIVPGTAARKSGLSTPVASAAAELAASAKFSATAEGEIRRDVAFAASLLERHKAAPTPAPAAATHIGAAAPSQATQASVATIQAQVGAQGWDQGLGDKLVWMAGQKQQVAELHLNPPDLGPLKITLTLNHEHASAQFVSAHAQVRDAIETAMPRLREMLADSGITLGNTSVGTDAFREQAQPQQEPRAYSGAPAAATADSGAVSHGEQLLRRARGLVDTFA
ncbi:MAG: flagellar hook-length control protein FliK [Burkholderiales bacterium]|nr:flagellar hook-length control protein FliK [Burkholderiales bacterium]